MRTGEDRTADGHTPLRRVVHGSADGCRILSEQPVVYADGAEQRVFELVVGCADVSSMSEEIEYRAQSLPELYHVARTRSNVLRALDLPAGACVLEVGAGCGAVTRYLGEECAVVDALEPKFDRARVARERTRDLGNTEVFVGGLEDVPDEPAYDVIVFCGVLEYLGEGAADHAPYVDALSRSRRLLRPGGVVVCAIENQIGVKYFSGAREDHTSRAFDGIEGYPRGSRARTFPRREMESLFTQAGLAPRVLHAFPDYKATRVVFDDQLLGDGAQAELAWRLPIFPSVDWWHAGAWQVVDERRLWRTLVEAGLGGETANSFLVVGGTDDSPNPPETWPSDRVAIYLNVADRASRFARRTQLTTGHDGEMRFERELLVPATEPLCAPLELRVDNERFVSGVDLVDVLADPDDPRGAPALREWLTRLAELVETGSREQKAVPLDFAPHNLVLDGDGVLHAIDQEWWWHGVVTLEDAAVFGVLAVVNVLARREACDSFQDRTVADVALEIAERAGLPLSRLQLEDALQFVAGVHARVAPRFGADGSPTEHEICRMLSRSLDRPMRELRDEQFVDFSRLEDEAARAWSSYEQVLSDARSAEQHYIALVQERDELLVQIDVLREQVATERSRADRTEAELVATRGRRSLKRFRRSR